MVMEARSRQKRSTIAVCTRLPTIGIFNTTVSLISLPRSVRLPRSIPITAATMSAPAMMPQWPSHPATSNSTRVGKGSLALSVPKNVRNFGSTYTTSTTVTTTARPSTTDG